MAVGKGFSRAEAQSILEVVRAGWRLDAVRKPSRIWLGGRPELTPDETWPTNDRGVPMTFLAQVDTEALPALDDEWRATVELPDRRQVFRVFADLLDGPHDPGPAVVLATADAASLSAAAVPAIATPLPSGGPSDGLSMSERFWDLRQRFGRARPTVTLPRDLTGVVDNDAADAVGLASQLWGSSGELAPWEFDHFCGHGFNYGIDDRVVVEPRGEVPSHWRTLVAIHDRPDQEILDEGSFTVLVRLTDLQRGAVSMQGYCDLQSG